MPSHLPSPDIQPGKNLFFSDKGKYTVVDTRGWVETGSYFVDTRPAEQATNHLEWESLYQLSPDKQIAPTEEDDPDGLLVPNAYKSQGEAIRLWELELDLKGQYARQVHQKILELAKCGTPADILTREVKELAAQIRESFT